MLRAGIPSSFRPLLGQNILRATGRQPFIASTRNFSNFRPNILQTLQKQRPTLKLFTPSRSLSDHTVINARPTQAQTWTRIGLGAVSILHFVLREHRLTSNKQGAVIGTIVIIDSFFNRETRDSLADFEKSYLHESFKYTGGGLVLTALAARGLFRSGVAYRIMAANPCA